MLASRHVLAKCRRAEERRAPRNLQNEGRKAAYRAQRKSRDASRACPIAGCDTYKYLRVSLYGRRPAAAGSAQEQHGSELALLKRAKNRRHDFMGIVVEFYVLKDLRLT